MKVEEVKEVLEKNRVKIPAHINSKQGVYKYLQNIKALYTIKRYKLRETLKDIENRLEAINEALEMLDMVSGIDEEVNMNG